MSFHPEGQADADSGEAAAIDAKPGLLAKAYLRLPETSLLAYL